MSPDPLTDAAGRDEGRGRGAPRGREPCLEVEPQLQLMIWNIPV